MSSFKLGGLFLATIIAAHDLSGVGRCSLTTALAVLPAFGHTCYPLPTAVLSQQTGLPGYSFLDMTAHLPAYLAGWRDLPEPGISPDWIYTGFLGNGEQAAMLSEFIKSHPDAVAAIDPVMGDNGEVYPCYDEGFVREMRRLARSAHILLPNSTEFNLLCGLPGSRELPQEPDGLISMALSLGAPGLRAVIITSAVYQAKTCNLFIDAEKKSALAVPYRHSGVAYGGAGDLFASVVCALAANGADISRAVRHAADFVSGAAALMPAGSDPRLGIRYEPLLCKFINSIEEDHII